MQICFLLFLLFFPVCAGVALFAFEKHAAKSLPFGFELAGAVELLLAVGFFFLPEGALSLPGILGFGLSFEIDGFRKIWVLLAALIWLVCTAWERANPQAKTQSYGLFSFVTLGCVMGVVLSGDFFTLFVFFEMMSFSSYFLAVAKGTEAAQKAANTYLAIGVLGGLVSLMGIFLLAHNLQTLRFGEMHTAFLAVADKTPVYLAGGCVLFGFGAKAGMFPLHFWLPAAYAQAPVGATVLLSAVLSKTGIFGVLYLCSDLFFADVSWGIFLLILAFCTMLLGGVRAVFETDVKRILAYSSMAQMGYILFGSALLSLLGENGQVAASAVFLHMINHSLVKTVLFLCADHLAAQSGSSELSALRGAARKSGAVQIFLGIGFLSLAGIAPLSGYISKTLLHQSLAAELKLLSFAENLPLVMQLAEWLFLLAGGLTVAYVLKLAGCLFAKSPQTQKSEKFPVFFQVMLGAFSAAMVLGGVFPHQIAERAAHFGQSFFGKLSAEAPVQYLEAENLYGVFISLAMGLLIYGLVVLPWMSRKNQDKTRTYLSRWREQFGLLELVYRPAAKALVFIGAAIARILSSCVDAIIFFIWRYLIKRAPETVIPKTDEKFGRYPDKSIHRGIVGETLAYELLLYGIGVVITFLYLLLQ